MDINGNPGPHYVMAAATALNKKQVSGVGGLAIKNYILHIYVGQSRIMQFLYLKLFIEL